MIRWKLRPPRRNVSRTGAGTSSAGTGCQLHDRTCTRSAAYAAAESSHLQPPARTPRWNPPSGSRVQTTAPSRTAAQRRSRAAARSPCSRSHPGVRRDRCGGLSAEEIDRAFDTGWQHNQARTPTHDELAHGAGLGLAVVKGIVEAHRGRVLVENLDQRAGCRFSVLLPV